MEWSFGEDRMLSTLEILNKPKRTIKYYFCCCCCCCRKKKYA